MDILANITPLGVLKWTSVIFVVTLQILFVLAMFGVFGD